MARIRTLLPQTLSDMGGSMEQAAKASRAAEVRRMWEKVMLQGGDRYILEHTNNVFILDSEDAKPFRSDHDDRKDVGGTGQGKQLIVYVDESIVAAELNARRELVKLQFFELFGEEIDTFKIIISRGQYKKHHPFMRDGEGGGSSERVAGIPLDDEERALVQRQVAAIEDPHLRQVVQRAMISDLEWKKALKD